MKKRFLLILFFFFTFLSLQGIVTAKDTKVLNEKEKTLLQNIEVKETETVYYVNPLYKDKITVNDLIKFDEGHLYANESIVYNVNTESAGTDLRAGMKKRENTINVAIRTTEEFQKLIRDIFAEATKHTGISTEGDYLKWQYGGWTAKASYRTIGEDYYYNITYTVTYYTTQAQEDVLTAEIQKLKKSLNLNGTKYENFTKVYDYIINNITYDYDHLNDSSYKLQFTAYGSLVNKTSVCQGYAVLIYRLALELGIDSRLISGYGNGGPHGWNIVKLGEYYYNVDATWDASYSKYNKKPYYLVSNENFGGHTRDNEYNTADFNKKYPMSQIDYNERLTLKEGLLYNEDTKKWEYFVNGKPDYTYNGVATNDKGTWLIDKGIVTFNHNEVVRYNNRWVVFVNSRLDKNFTGISKNANGTWYAENGIVNCQYNGTYKDKNGKIYTIKNSKVVA